MSNIWMPIKICGEHVEDRANSAITRILCQSCFARTLRINGNYTFWSRTFYMGTDYFFVKFPEVLGKKDIAYFGITSEAPEQFKEAYEYLAEKEEGAQYIVMAATHELACAISKWVLKIMGNRLQVWYCGYEDNGFFDSDTDAVIDIETAVASSDESVLKPAAIVKSTLSEAEKIKYTEEYQKMLISGKFYGATAYVKALSAEIPYFEPIYRQLAFSYDYYLQQLQAMVSGNEVLGEDNLIDNIVYTLCQFKNDNHRGIDRYADYREKERVSWEIRLEENRREAEEYYNNYCARNLKENASHKRFIETEKLLFGVSSELSEYLQVVIKDEREMLDLLEGFLVQYYVKDQAAICKENIEPAKIDVVLNKYWDMAAQNMRPVKKSSDLMSSLRMNLFKRVKKIVSVLCDYGYISVKIVCK